MNTPAGTTFRFRPALTREATVRILGSFAMILALCAPAEGQTPEAGGDLTSRVAAARALSLPAEHWATRAAARAEALGLVSLYLPAQGSIPRSSVAAALREAAQRAPVEAPALAPLASAWYTRFMEEISEVRDTVGPVEFPRLLGSSVGAGARARSGFAQPGRGLDVGRTGATSLPDRFEGFSVAAVAVTLAPGVHILVEPEIGSEGADLVRVDLGAAVGPLATSIGRKEVSYGSALGGGMVLSGGVPLDLIEIQTIRPVELPGYLRHLGPIAFQTFLSRLSGDRHPERPYLWGARGALRPHPRLTLAVQRAAMFGGDSATAPVNVENVARMLVGMLTPGFENQVVAVDARYRLPTERLFPLTAYLEWGAEDAAGSWWDVPGRTVGVLVPSLPGLPHVALGAEYSSFAHRCCGNPPWYRHHMFLGGWAAADVPLGHPLGGEGRQFLLYSTADLLAARLRIDGRAFLRERGSDGLYAPGREAGSLGAEIGTSWRVSPRTELRFTAYGEDGAGWREHRLAAGAFILF